MAKLSPESLYKLRRLRAARFHWKKSPLFAFATMKTKYPEYTAEMFSADLHPRKRRKAHRKKTSTLPRYGRFFKMQELIRQYFITGETSSLLNAQRLRNRITHPYRVLIRKDNQAAEYHFPATTSYTIMVDLMEQVNKSADFIAACQLTEKALSLCRMGG